MNSTIITRNIQRLGEKFLDQVNYVDIDYRGFLEDGSFPTITEGAVMVNMLKLWLMSTKGDYYRKPLLGGFFDDVQQYELSSDGAVALGAALESAINENFPTVTIISKKVDPDLAGHGWRIQLVVKDSISGIISSLNTSVDQ